VRGRKRFFGAKSLRELIQCGKDQRDDYATGEFENSSQAKGRAPIPKTAPLVSYKNTLHARQQEKTVGKRGVVKYFV